MDNKEFIKENYFFNLKKNIFSAIERIKPDLNGLRVLTEAGTNAFVCTPIIASLSGAKEVIACTRDSKWGSAKDIKNVLDELASICKCPGKIIVTKKQPFEVAKDIDLVTNLSFVRPIDKKLLKQLSKNACIALMWEPWEFREEDIDKDECNKLKIPIIGTNESNNNLNTFKAVGLLAVKLLIERQVSIYNSNILVIASDPFGENIVNFLKSLGAHTISFKNIKNKIEAGFLEKLDAIVIAENRIKKDLIKECNTSFYEIISRKRIELIHICGLLDYKQLHKYNINKYPKNEVSFGYMTETTAYLGPKPVVDLHTGGLHAASIVCNSRKKGFSLEESINKAVKSGYGLELI